MFPLEHLSKHKLLGHSTIYIKYFPVSVRCKNILSPALRVEGSRAFEKDKLNIPNCKLQYHNLIKDAIV